jgi:hypothetical protein
MLQETAGQFIVRYLLQHNSLDPGRTRKKRARHDERVFDNWNWMIGWGRIKLID